MKTNSKTKAAKAPKAGRTSAKKSAAAPSKRAAKAPKEPKVRKPGVISTAVELLKGAGKAGITRDAVLKALTKKFPDREAENMNATLGHVLYGRLPGGKRMDVRHDKESGKFTFVKDLPTKK